MVTVLKNVSTRERDLLSCCPSGQYITAKRPMTNKCDKKDLGIIDKVLLVVV